MRQIKFRIWSIGRNKWLNECMLDMEVKGAYDFSSDSSVRYNYKSDVIIEQFTGLKDRNGVEIYEGDVLTTWIQGYKQTTPYIVEDIRELYLETERDDSYYCINKMEIIGNIHQHPELLENK